MDCDFQDTKLCFEPAADWLWLSAHLNKLLAIKCNILLQCAACSCEL
jgi:hypothetical protein